MKKSIFKAYWLVVKTNLLDLMNSSATNSIASCSF
jgi:hypothetical protein